MAEQFTFLDEIQAIPVNIPRAALRYASEISYPGLDIASYLRYLDEMAATARPILANKSGMDVKVTLLANYLFEQLGFRGNNEAFDDPLNSYLNDVLDRRLGIPITLSVIFVAVAERLGLPVHGVGLPGHFIVRVEGEDEYFYLDPFNGGRRLSVIDCARLVELSTGYSGLFQPSWLRPAQPLEILSRMLFNLRNVYIQRNNWQMALPVVERLCQVEPGVSEHLRDLGTVQMQNKAYSRAIESFQRYLALAPDVSDADIVRENLRDLVRRLASRN